MKKLDFKTTDLYLASWLIMNGAEVIGLTSRKRDKKTSDREHRSFSWKVTLKLNDDSAWIKWKSHLAIADIREFEKVRRDLKLRIAKLSGRMLKKDN